MSIYVLFYGFEDFEWSHNQINDNGVSSIIGISTYSQCEYEISSRDIIIIFKK